MSDSGDGLRKEPATLEGSRSERKTGFPVVGIGASAGGLEAFVGMLKALPTNLGMAYVFVPHLDPSRASALTEILGRATSMAVVEAGEGTVVEPDHVYVIPRNC